MKHLRARLSIAENKIILMKIVMNERKKRASGKRVVLKNQIVYTKPEILAILKVTEKATKEWKKKGSIRVSRKRKIASLEVESTSEDTDDQSDHEREQDDREIMSEIEVEIP